MSRVVVSGLGAITPLGVNLSTTWKKLLAGESGLVLTQTFSDYESAGWDQIPSKVVGKVPLDEWNSLDKIDSRRMALFAQYSIAATQEALEDSQLDMCKVDRTKFGVAVGSGIGSFHDIYDNLVLFNKGGYRKVQPLFIPKLLTNMAAGNISIKYGLLGPLHSVSSACATGLHAVGDAYNFISNGYADVMICGGAESLIHPLALAGFARSRSVSTDYNENPTEASRPFDSKRSGFVLAEGCGILILEKLEHALARKAPIYAEVKGYGLSGDAHHITAPMENGEGAYLAMKMAIERSGLKPRDINYINAHATSTIIGDRAENNAMMRLFTNRVAVSSTKGSIGHLLGAAGAVESIFTVKAIHEGQAPPTLNLREIGGHAQDVPEQFNKFDYLTEATKMDIDFALCNSFGFGGVNSSVCFGKYQND